MMIGVFPFFYIGFPKNAFVFLFDTGTVFHIICNCSKKEGFLFIFI